MNEQVSEESLVTMLNDLIPDDEYTALLTEQLRLELPVEVRVGTNAGEPLNIMMSVPWQTFPTSFMPVFHRLHINIVAEDNTQE